MNISIINHSPIGNPISNLHLIDHSKSVKTDNPLSAIHLDTLKNPRNGHQVHVKGSWIASNHPSFIPLLDEEQKNKMMKGVSQDLIENDLDIEVMIPTASSSISVDNTEMQTILDSLKVKPVKELSKHQRKKLNRKKRSTEAVEKREKEQQLQLQALAKQTEIARQIDKRGFTLKAIRNDSQSERLKDKTQLGEDFRFGQFTEEEIAKRHMWKRINFFLVMSRYIEEKTPYLKDFNFPSFAKNQFKVSAYVIPPSYEKRELGEDDYIRAHISLLNKIVVQQDENVFKMEGQLKTGNNITTTLYEFFNICDIVPPAINSIDWYVEFFLRDYAYTLLNEVKEGKMTFAEVSYIFAKEYASCLFDLQDRIADQDTILHKDRESEMKIKFKEEMEKIMEDEETSRAYIDGMLKAIIHFRCHFPNLRNLLVSNDQYRLYEKI